MCVCVWGERRCAIYNPDYRAHEAISLNSTYLSRIIAWCRRRRHLPLKAQQQALSRKLLGHYSYYGLTGNAPSLSRYRYEVLCIWRRHLARRNHQGLPWWKFLRLLEHYPLPIARVVHSIYHRRVANP